MASTCPSLTSFTAACSPKHHPQSKRRWIILSFHVVAPTCAHGDASVHSPTIRCDDLRCRVETDTKPPLPQDAQIFLETARGLLGRDQSVAAKEGARGAGVSMRFIRFILIDLALMLVAPENAEAMTVAPGANFKSARKAVGCLMRISGPEPVFSSGLSRHLYRQTSRAAQFGHSAKASGPAKQAENLALRERRFASHWQAHWAASDCHDPRGAEMLRKPLILTQICSPPPQLMPSGEQRRRAGAAPAGLSKARRSSLLQLCS